MNDTRRSLAMLVVVGAGIGVAWLSFGSGPSPTSPSSSAPPPASAPPLASGPVPPIAPSSQPSSRVVEAPPYASSADGFEITFPSLSPPKIDEGEQETGRGKVPVRTYYVTYGASAYSLAAARYGRDVTRGTPTDALTREIRDDIVERIGAKLVGERPFELKGPEGSSYRGLYQELALPRGLRGLYAVVFVCDVAYTMSAAGPVGDAGLDASLFGAFVASMRITARFGCPTAK